MSETLKILVCGFGGVYLLIRFLSSLRTIMNRSGYLKTRSDLGIWSVGGKSQAEATIQEELESPTSHARHGSPGVRQ